jgi:UDP:flavonoid glycosyltransferase YjiC (YdhE family)
MVCMPMGRDQDDTAARVVHAGAGLRIKPKADSPTIARTLTRVLQEDRFRTNVRRLGAAVANELRRSDLVAEFEKVGQGPPAQRGMHAPQRGQ